MIPRHHPYPETLISYAARTLPNAVACVVACHLSMCVVCTKQIRWLEMLGGVLLSDLETSEEEPLVAERVLTRSSVKRRSYERNHKPAMEIDGLLLPLPLARYLSVNGAEIAWKPIGSRSEEHAIELPSASGSVKLLRLSPGQHLPEHSFSLETGVALVLEGACRDSAGTYSGGDIVEWAENPPHRPMVAADAGCVCLMAD